MFRGNNCLYKYLWLTVSDVAHIIEEKKKIDARKNIKRLLRKGKKKIYCSL